LAKQATLLLPHCVQVSDPTLDEDTFEEVEQQQHQKDAEALIGQMEDAGTECGIVL
jgi:hypothetical protein